MPIIGPRGNKPPASGAREAAPGRDRNGERWPDDPASVGPQDRQHHAPQRRAPEQGSQEPWLGSGDVLPDWPDARAQPHQQQPGPGRPQTAPQSAPDDHAWEWSGGFGAL